MALEHGQRDTRGPNPRMDRKQTAVGAYTLEAVTITKPARATKAVGSYLRDMWTRREFAWYMAMGNLRARNASTALGLFWWVLNPLLMGGVYYFVFGVILGVSRDLSFLLSGIFVFYYTSTVITTGANAIIQNKTLLVNLRFPRLILPLTALLETGIGFIVSIPAMYLIIGRLPPLRIIVLFPIAFVIQSVYNLGLAAGVGAIAVPFRDITNIVPHLLRIWLYLSPILYTASKYEGLDEPWRTLVHLNPMVPILGLYRSALLGYKFHPAELWAATFWAIATLIVGFVAFVRYEGKMARYL
jgi:ABC-type polysaccharide/polyol phosphate export permease